MISDNVFACLNKRHLAPISKYASLGRHLFILPVLGLALTACAPVSDQVTTDPDNNIPLETTLSGSVGDGPITGAQIKLSDATGVVLTTAVSDTNASYTVDVAEGSAYPVLVEATGGTDIVTGSAPDFTLLSVAIDSSADTVNINPYTTLVVKTAQVMPGGLNPANVSTAKRYVVDQLNFGLDLTLVSDPVTTPINEANVAVIIKASEALGEAIRRSRNALLVSGSAISEDEIVDAIAADLSDGVIDGRGPGATNARIAATTSLAAGQVAIETLGNHLNVGGGDVTSLMDNAINMSVPTATMTTADVRINEGLIFQARVALAAASVHTPNAKITSLAVILAGLSGNALASDINKLLPVDADSVFNEVISSVPLGSNSDFEVVNASVRARNTVTAPVAAPGVFEYAASAYSVGESDGTVDITINRVGGSDGVATVEWKTKGISATFADDYGNFDWTQLTFADGETSKTQVVTITSDVLVEGDESFSVLLQNPTAGTELGVRSSAVVTIVDDDVEPAPAPEPPLPEPAPIGNGQPYEDLVNQVVGFGSKTTGGKGGEICTVSSLANSGTGTLRSCLQSAGAKWIRFSVSGVIDLAASRISAKSNKTVDGRGANITIVNGGIDLIGIENVIIHNLKFTDQSFKIGGVDNQPIGIPYINILRNTRNIWIDHVTISNNKDDPVQIGNTGTGTSPRDITVSWCKWENNVNKVFAIGFNPTKFPDDINITATLHHNYFNDTTQRHPRVSQAKVHSFNNYLYSWGGSMPASLAVQNAEIFSENNIYEAGPNKVGLGAQASGSGVTEAGFTRSKGDMLLNGAQVKQVVPANVFVPDSFYSYTAETADSNLKTKIINEAGWRDVPAPK